MRRSLLAVAAVAAGVLVVPAALAVSGSSARPVNAGGDAQHYTDPALAGRATVSVRGTLLPIHSEAPGADDDSYAVELAGGQLVPVSLDLPVEEPRRFTGDLAVDGTLTRRLTGRGIAVASGQRLSGTSTQGRRLLAVASTSTHAVPVRSAELTAADEPTDATVSASPHQLYVAVINNRGTLASTSTVAAQVQAMRTFWTTESDGMISSFDQVGASQYYASIVAPSTTDGCGLGDPTAVWNEAAARFPGVSFGSTGAHLMVLVSSACSGKNGAGIGTVGGSLRSGGRSIVSLGDGGVQIGVHELGHNLSLQHANAQYCPTTCTTQGYMDVYSIMGLAVTGGGWTPPSLDTAYRVLDGIATDAEVPTVTEASSVHLSPRSSASGVRGFLVTDPTTKAKFAVEYRSGTGSDASAFYATGRSLGNFSYRPGVVVTRMEQNGSTTLMTRETTNNSYLTSYAAGGSFAAGSLRLTITAAAPSSGADVAVSFGGSSAPPTSSPTNSPAPPATFTPGTPRIVGRAQVGTRLAAWTGSWTPTPTRFTYQWYANGRGIYGATHTTFVPTSSQRGDRISVGVTATRSGYTTTSRFSASTGTVASGRFRTHSVAISGTRKVGHTLRAHTSGWSPSPYFTYRWYASGRAIAKGYASRLHITRSLRGKRITVRVTAYRGGYVTAARVAPSTSRVR